MTVQQPSLPQPAWLAILLIASAPVFRPRQRCHPDGEPAHGSPEGDGKRVLAPPLQADGLPRVEPRENYIDQGGWQAAPVERARESVLPRGRSDNHRRSGCCTAWTRTRTNWSSRPTQRRAIHMCFESVQFVRAVCSVGPRRAVVSASTSCREVVAGATRVGVSPAHWTAFEDVIAGVEAGDAMAFGIVVSVDAIGSPTPCGTALIGSSVISAKGLQER
jgi:hypothetical protein